MSNGSVLNEPVLNEIAISCIDLVQTEKWFREGLGFARAGGRRFLSGSAMADDALAAPGAEAIGWWMVGGGNSCRLALYQFSIPYPRLGPSQPHASDPGYTGIVVHVPRLDAALAALEALGSPVIGAVTGTAGRRRACVLSPDGLFVELMEEDPLARGQAAPARDGASLRGVMLAAPDIEGTAARFSALLGIAPDTPPLHDGSHEILWRLEGARPRRVAFHCGDIVLELAGYDDRGIAMDRRISDQGLFEIGFAFASRREWGERMEQAASSGWDIRARALETPRRASVHLSANGVAVKAGWSAAPARLGFQPRPADRCPPPARHHVHAATVIAAPLARVWTALNDHDRMGQWIEADEFGILRHGHPYSAGHGAERRLQTMGREVFQQVIRVYPLHVGYRATKSPFAYHNGTVDIAPCEGGTRIDWRIRYRTARDRRIGDAILPQLQAGIEHMLDEFRAMVEAEDTAHG